MQRYVFFVYGIGCHLLFLVTFAYMAVFVGNLLGSKTIDTTVDGPIRAALAIDLTLLGLFAVQHSVMARPSFKRVWTRIVPKPIERSTYVLVSCAFTILLMWQWRGIDTLVWNVQHPVFRAAVWGLFAIGWLLVPGVTLLIDHFDLFGTRQVWLHLQGLEYNSLPFRVPLFYKHVRHPLYLGWTIAFWATPTMTLGHLLFAAVLTGYMGLAALLEERNLIDHFGQQYADYQRNVPMFVPRLRAVAPVSPAWHETEPVAQPAESEACHV
jgi:protein-S-isoprenylcysteine O-methyltransferase Ste14